MLKKVTPDEIRMLRKAIKTGTTDRRVYLALRLLKKGRRHARKK